MGLIQGGLQAASYKRRIKALSVIADEYFIPRHVFGKLVHIDTVHVVA